MLRYGKTRLKCLPCFSREPLVCLSSLKIFHLVFDLECVPYELRIYSAILCTERTRECRCFRTILQSLFIKFICQTSESTKAKKGKRGIIKKALIIHYSEALISIANKMLAVAEEPKHFQVRRGVVCKLRWNYQSKRNKIVATEGNHSLKVYLIF